MEYGVVGIWELDWFSMFVVVVKKNVLYCVLWGVFMYFSWMVVVDVVDDEGYGY